MFVSNLTKPVALMGSVLILSLVGATTAYSAGSSNSDWKIQPGNIPVIVTLTNLDPVLQGSDPVYVSIQTEDQYQSLKGRGGIAAHAKTGSMTATFFVEEAGEYAVSVWHDRDGDGRFSMSKDYTRVLDSYGSSGEPPADRAPLFDEVKIPVPNMGASITIDMINPA